MEKYFIVTEESRLHKDYFDYKKNLVEINELVKPFLIKHGIEATKYRVSDEEFCILPTKTDAVKFAPFLCQPDNCGAQKFKKNSGVVKSWIKLLKESGMKVLGKPPVILYVRTDGGRFNTRLFDINDILYCSIESAGIYTEKGFQEIKASEFYKIIEDSE